MKPLSFAWRNVRREFRYGELSTLAAALVLAVAALCAVATLGLRVERAIVAGAAELIGGDLGVSARGTLPPQLDAEAARLGLERNASAEFPSVLFANGASQLCEIRASDPSYPLRGQLRLRDGDDREYSAHAPEPGLVYADHRVLAALGVKLGDTLAIGDRSLRVAAEVVREPDGGQLFALAPRVLMNLDDARASGLLGIGSRARYRLMLAGSAAALAEFSVYARAHLPDGAELITLERTQQNLRTAFERGESFLRLAALLAALLSGIAVALAAQRYARRKTDEVALLRCLGASKREVLAALSLTLMLLALPACVLGVALGLGLQEIVLAFARDLLPGAAPGLPFGPAAAAFAVGLAVLFGFALPPLLRLREVPPVRVFQRAVGMRVRRFDALYLLPIAVSAGLIYAQSSSLKLATILSGSLLAVAGFALIVGALLILAIARLGRYLPSALRFGLANLARRRGLSLVQITALALGLTALNLLAIVGPSLLAAWRAELPADTPNYFLLNLQPEQSDAVAARLAALDARGLNMLPLAAGKLIAINGRTPRADDYAGDERAAGRINGETRFSWTAQLPESNRVLSGRWFAAAPKEPELSIDQSWVNAFHLQLGDTLTLRVGERDITARITSVRSVDWSSFRVNFFLLLDPVSARDLGHSLLASFYLAPARNAELAAITRDYPNLSLIDINALLDRVRQIIGRVSRAVAWVLGFSLVAGLLVLAAALAMTADERRFEGALLRTLGARRGQLRAAVLGEFALLGLVAGAIAAVGAGAAGYWLAHALFKIAYVPPVAALATAALGATALVAFAGWLGTRRIGRTSPLLVLRRV